MRIDTFVDGPGSAMMAWPAEQHYIAYKMLQDRVRGTALALKYAGNNGKDDEKLEIQK